MVELIIMIVEGLVKVAKEAAAAKEAQHAELLVKLEEALAKGQALVSGLKEEFAAKDAQTMAEIDAIAASQGQGEPTP